MPTMGGTMREAALLCTPSLRRFTKAQNLERKRTINHQIDPTNLLCFRVFFLTGNTVPASGRNTCLRCRPRCSRPGVEMQKSHSAGEGSRVLLLCLPTDDWKYRQALHRLRVCRRPAGFNAPLFHTSLLNHQSCSCSRRAAMMCVLGG